MWFPKAGRLLVSDYPMKSSLCALSLSFFPTPFFKITRVQTLLLYWHHWQVGWQLPVQSFAMRAGGKFCCQGESSAQEGYYSHKQLHRKISSQLQAGRKCVSQPQRTTVAFLILVASLCEQDSHPPFHPSESRSKARIHNLFQLDAVWKPE